MGGGAFSGVILRASRGRGPKMVNLPAGDRLQPKRPPKRVAILGSTGSIGDSTIDLIERNPTAYKVVALTANSNWAKLAEQAKRLRPEMVALADPTGYAALKEALAGTNIG